ncbi:PCNA-associated factor isoform X1 [Bubalus kerabau]|nr:PCNA-associated factor isoform X1 [Bubalus bubalis]XP_055392361.1 PCNA-associated factor isoform X1 [Bubalus carabanensis]
MVRTKANSVPGSYRKVVASRAPRKVLGSSTSAANSTPLSSRKAENKYAGGNPVCVRPTPKWQKGIGEFFSLSPKDSEKENRIPEEAGSSGLGKAKRKVLAEGLYCFINLLNTLKEDVIEIEIPS